MTSQPKRAAADEAARAERPDPAATEEVPPLRVKLRKPVQAHGEEITEITFREPNGLDIETCGNPVIFDPSPTAIGEPPKISFDERKMVLMMARLATVPPSTIRTMNTKDWANCAWALASFFVPDMGPTD